MASSIWRSNYEKKALHVLGFFSMVLFMQKIDARELMVGGSAGWTVPNSNADSLNQWAEKNRFLIGDSLLFVYPSEKDSVLQVNKDDYINCGTASPIAKFNDGHTSFTFSTSGPFYFISGIQEKCSKNEKIVVVVIADRSGKAENASFPAPSVSPLPPPPTPSTAPPPPPPPSEASPPAPETSSMSPATTPASAPTETVPPPPNAAYSKEAKFMTSLGALLGSSLLISL